MMASFTSVRAHSDVVFTGTLYLTTISISLSEPVVALVHDLVDREQRGSVRMGVAGRQGLIDRPAIRRKNFYEGRARVETRACDDTVPCTARSRAAGLLMMMNDPMTLSRPGSAEGRREGGYVDLLMIFHFCPRRGRRPASNGRRNPRSSGPIRSNAERAARC